MSLPNYPVQQCAWLNTHTALLIGNGHVTVLATKRQGKSAGCFEETVCFPDKRYHGGWRLLAAAVIPPSGRKGQGHNRSASQTDRHQPLKPRPATTYLQTSYHVRKVNHYLLKPLRQGFPLLEAKPNPNCVATAHSFPQPLSRLISCQSLC